MDAPLPASGAASSIKAKFEQQNAKAEEEKLKATPKQAPKQPPVMAKAPAAAKKPPAPAAKGVVGKAPTPKGAVGSIARQFNKPNVNSPQPTALAKQPSAAALKNRFERKIETEARGAASLKEKQVAPPKPKFGKKAAPPPNIPSGNAQGLHTKFEAKAAGAPEPEVLRTGKRWAPPGGESSSPAPARASASSGGEERAQEAPPAEHHEEAQEQHDNAEQQEEGQEAAPEEHDAGHEHQEGEPPAYEGQEGDHQHQDAPQQEEAPQN